MNWSKYLFLFATFMSLFSTTLGLSESQQDAYKVTLTLTVGTKNAVLPFNWTAISNIYIQDISRDKLVFSSATKQLAEGFNIADDVEHDGNNLLMINVVSFKHAGVYKMENLIDGTIVNVVIDVVGELKCESLGDEDLGICSAHFAGPDIPNISLVGAKHDMRCEVTVDDTAAVGVKTVYCRIQPGYSGCKLSYNHTTFQMQLCLLKHGSQWETSTKPTQSQILQRETIDVQLREMRSNLFSIHGLLIYVVVIVTIALACDSKKFVKRIIRLVKRRRDVTTNAQQTDSPTEPRERDYEMLPTAEAAAKLVHPVEVEDSHLENPADPN